MPTKKQANWLYTVTKNEAITYLKRKKEYINIEDIYEILEKNKEIDKIIDKEYFNSIISKLNDKEKEIISFKLVSNLSFEEISKVINEPVGTVKCKYYRSIHTLKLLISNLGMFIITFCNYFYKIPTKRKEKNV